MKKHYIVSVAVAVLTLAAFFLIRFMRKATYGYVGIGVEWFLLLAGASLIYVIFRTEWDKENEQEEILDDDLVKFKRLMDMRNYAYHIFNNAAEFIETDIAVYSIFIIDLMIGNLLRHINEKESAVN